MLNLWFSDKNCLDKKISLIDISILILIQKNSPNISKLSDLRTNFESISSSSFYRRINFLSKIKILQNSSIIDKKGVYMTQKGLELLDLILKSLINNRSTITNSDLKSI